jgi:hypothetical protein
MLERLIIDFKAAIREAMRGGGFLCDEPWYQNFIRQLAATGVPPEEIQKIEDTVVAEEYPRRASN